jgi:hypothetical protein
MPIRERRKMAPGGGRQIKAFIVAAVLVAMSKGLEGLGAIAALHDGAAIGSGLTV